MTGTADNIRAFILGKPINLVIDFSLLKLTDYSHSKMQVISTNKTCGMHKTYNGILLAAPQGAPECPADRISFTSSPIVGLFLFAPINRLAVNEP